MTTTAISQPVVQRRGPWSRWWLTLITLGFHYFFWYHRINSELARATNSRQPAWGQWWNQIIPFWSFVGLHHTAKKLRAAIQANGGSDSVSPAVAWFWGPIWFGTHTVYLQRRMNRLADYMAIQATK